jgi:hypothetical protein
VHDADAMQFQLLRRADLYADVQGDIVEDIVVPVVAGSAINLLLLGAFLGLLLWPLSRLVRQLESRNADSLEPLTVRTPIAEIGVLRDALNRLMEGIDSVLRRERQFSNDVAREPDCARRRATPDPRPNRGGSLACQLRTDPVC